MVRIAAAGTARWHAPQWAVSPLECRVVEDAVHLLTVLSSMLGPMSLWPRKGCQPGSGTTGAYAHAALK